MFVDLFIFYLYIYVCFFVLIYIYTYIYVIYNRPNRSQMIGWWNCLFPLSWKWDEMFMGGMDLMIGLGWAAKQSVVVF